MSDESEPNHRKYRGLHALVRHSSAAPVGSTPIRPDALVPAPRGGALSRRGREAMVRRREAEADAVGHIAERERLKNVAIEQSILVGVDAARTVIHGWRTGHDIRRMEAEAERAEKESANRVNEIGAERDRYVGCRDADTRRAHERTAQAAQIASLLRDGHGTPDERAEWQRLLRAILLPDAPAGDAEAGEPDSQEGR